MKNLLIFLVFQAYLVDLASFSVFSVSFFFKLKISKDS